MEALFTFFFFQKIIFLILVHTILENDNQSSYFIKLISIHFYGHATYFSSQVLLVPAVTNLCMYIHIWLK